MAQILALVDDDEVRSRLVEWLAGRYDVLGPGTWADRSVDLCLVVPGSLERYADRLEHVEAAAEPAFVPVLLVVPGGDAREAADAATGTDWGWDRVDSVVAPDSKLELWDRIDDLVRTRDLSRQITAGEETESEAFGRLFEDAPDPELVVDGSGRLVAVNESARGRFGVDEADVLGTRLADLEWYPEAVLSRVRARLDQRAGRGSGVEEVGFEWNGVDGAVELATTGGYGRRDHRVLLRDVTTRLGTRRALERERERIEFLNRLLRHHVLNGMNVVLGRARLLDRELDGEMRTHVDPILAHGDRLVELIERVDALTDPLVDDAMDSATTSATRLLDEEVERARESHPNAVITAWVPADLRVRGDELLGLAFEHLLDNAVQHNDEETPRVAVTVEETDGSVVVRVSDNGAGTSARQKRALFRDGSRLWEQPDTGFGLYIVNAVAKRYGADVWVEDNDPTGSTFCVALRRPAERQRASPRT